MCGHCGAIGPGINSWDLNIVKDLLTVSTLRGEDGTGVLQGKAHNWFGTNSIDYVIEKMAAQALYYKWYHSKSKQGNRRILSDIADNFFLCHVRAATKGYVTDENAHPFEFENIIGMHNGTLRDKKYEDKDKTDSEMMFKDMNERGIIPVLEELDPFSGYAIVVFNKEDGTISFARNEQRPLYFAIHESRSVLYYASEIWMLREMAARNTEKLYKNEIWYFQPNTLYTVHPCDIKGRNAMPFDQKKFKPKPYIVTQTKGKGGGRFQQQERLLLPSPPSIRNVKTTNVLSITGDKPLINARTKIPSVYCCACSKKLSLVDVFYATKLNNAGTTVVCQDCDYGFETDFKNELAKEVILN